jgi:hypothetical protein
LGLPWLPVRPVPSGLLHRLGTPFPELSIPIILSDFTW